MRPLLEARKVVALNRASLTKVAILAAGLMALTLVPITALAAPPVEVVTGPDARRCPPEDKPKDLRPGDRVRDCGVVVQVPPRGQGIYEENLLDTGEFEQLTVETDLDGTVV